MFNDTEMNIVASDEELAASLRLRLWAEHLEAEHRGDQRRRSHVESTKDGAPSRR